MCGWTEPWNCLDEPVEWGAEQAVEALANAIGGAVADMLQTLNGIWLGVDVTAGQLQSGQQDVLNEVHWIIGYIAVASLFIAAARTALDRRVEPLRQAFYGLLRTVIVISIATTVAAGLMVASDEFSREIYDKAELGRELESMLGALTAASPGTVIVIGIIVLIASLVQVCLMYVRIGVMVLLIGTLPIAASASMTDWGKGWWRKHVGWLAAWLLYKPAAALVMYSGAALTDEEGFDMAVAGLAMLVLSVFSLPALLKLVVPATAALGSASGGNVAAEVASGAIKIGSPPPGSGGGGSGSAAGGAGGGGGGGTAGGAAGAGAAGGAAGAGAAGGAAGGAGGAAAGGAAAAAAGPAAPLAAVGIEAAKAVQKTISAAANEVKGSLDDNDGNRGHNQ